MKKNYIPTVVITKMSIRWTYFQVFLLGFHQLVKQGKIKLKIQCDWLNRLSFFLPGNKMAGAYRRFVVSRFVADSYNVEGYVLLPGDKRKTFCIDSADAPFLFDVEALKRVDVYFKMQCPIDISNDGFRLSDEVCIPYSDYRHKDDSLTLTQVGERIPIENIEQYRDKIKPLVCGFRKLSSSNSLKSIQKGFDNYRKGVHNKASKKLMCYFGNSQGPKPSEHISHPDYDWESDIMGYYAGKLSHPNEKRSLVSKIIGNLGDDYDARIISDGFSDSKAPKRTDLIVPLSEFCAHVSNFEYNMNVSGYRMSIPNRFMESFIVGTAIMTDKLAVKWYLPFDEEVVETVRMGYLPNQEVDWETYKEDLLRLPVVDKSRINYLFEKKWAPNKIAEYMLNACIQQDDKKKLS